MSGPAPTVEEALGAYLDQASRLVDLPIPAEYRRGVLDNLDMLFGHARMVAAFPLDERSEVAPVFCP